MLGTSALLSELLPLLSHVLTRRAEYGRDREALLFGFSCLDTPDLSPILALKMKPGHSVQFTGLKGAAHLNGTDGTLVRFSKAEQRWAVRCEADQNIVNARPENLVLRQYEPEPQPRERRRRAGPGGIGGGAEGPTMGSVMAAGRGADSKEEYYLRTLLALGQQAQAANERGQGSNAQELVVDAVGAIVDKGEMDGDAGERFVKHLHRRTREEEARGNGTNAEIMGFIDTVLITKIVDRLAQQGPKDRPVTLPKWLHGSLAGSKTFNETMKSGGAQLARVAASERTRIVDEQESDEDEMQIPVIP
mmetsp:Transcript_24426/g.57327  ORF Transcript_24426/g.57327 Transcript_24426/m.57327 type:complete len:305 (-) Transcript_24426:1730-2644(-)